MDMPAGIRPSQVTFDPHSLDWIARNTDRRWALLLDYWRALIDRLDRLPKRSEIDPLDLPALLPNLFLVDVVREDGAPPRYRFRLLGGAITARETVRPGQFLDEFEGMRDSEVILQHYADALRLHIRLREATLAWDHPAKRYIIYEVILLPLSEDGQAVDTLLGLALYEV